MRRDLSRQLRPTNYSAADADVLHQLYRAAYEERLDGKDRLHVHNNSAIDAVHIQGDRVRLALGDRTRGTVQSFPADAVVLATGFVDLGADPEGERIPPLLSGIADELVLDAGGTVCVGRDYRLSSKSGLPLFLNGLCETSHGMGDAGSFSLVSIRAAEILASIRTQLGRHATREASETAMPGALRSGAARKAGERYGTEQRNL